MLKDLFILLVATSEVLTLTLNNGISTSIIENRLFCGCTDFELIQQYDELQTDYIKHKTSIWEKFKNLINTNKIKPLVPEICQKRSSLIKCDKPDLKIKIILASIGIHENVCVQDNSTYISLHSTGKTSCYEALKSTDITARLCDNKSECSLLIGADFSGICHDFNRQKHLNIVFKCIKNEKNLSRSKRFNKYEKDSRSRNARKFAAFLNLPSRWQYDMFKPYSFANNRRLWGTGFYDYYNYFNYNDDLNYGDYIEDNYYDDYYPYY